MKVLHRAPLAGILAALLLAIGQGAALSTEARQDIVHEVSLRLDPDTRDLQVKNRFTPRAGAEVAFAIAPWMRLVEARVDGKPVAPTRNGERVRLPASGRGDRQVEIALRGTVPPLPSPDQRGRVRGAVAGPEGSYLPGYAGWLPVTGDGRTRYRLSVQVPKAYRAVATGRLLEEETGEDFYRATFVAEVPGEWPTVFAGPYVIKERLEDGLRLRTYFHPEVASLADGYLEVSAARIKAYSEAIGAYPFSDFHIISAPLPVGLGFPNLTYVSRRILPLPFMRGRSLAHEILHNWWGNGVAVDYARGNWAEGLTTYQADYALAEEQGAAAAREMRLGWLRNLTALPAARDVPVTRFISKAHDAAQAVGYDKVAFIFHALRRELGDDVFRAGLQDFWQAQRFRVAGWADLQAAFERAAGRDLSGFLAQWLGRAGLPQVELAAAEPEIVEGAHKVTLTLRQQAPSFRLRVPLLIETAGGAVRREVVLDAAEKSFALEIADRPLAVHVDPDFDMLRRLLPGESAPIVRDVTLDDSTVVAIAARDGDVAENARRLAGRLLQREFTVVDRQEDLPPDVPVLVIGIAEDLAAFRARGDWGKSAELAGRGTSRAWTESRPGGRPMLIVEADSAEALGAMLRPLPHYRSRSFVVFEGSQALDKGVWPAPASPLSHRFGAS